MRPVPHAGIRVLHCELNWSCRLSLLRKVLHICLGKNSEAYVWWESAEDGLHGRGGGAKCGNDEFDMELLVLMKHSLGKLNKWDQKA